jgi:HSP20 family molecular chaperone IbpA
MSRKISHTIEYSNTSFPYNTSDGVGHSAGHGMWVGDFPQTHEGWTPCPSRPNQEYVYPNPWLPTINSPDVQITYPSSYGSTPEAQETPRDIYIDPDRNYCIDIVVAGYKRDQVEVESVKQTVKVIFKSESDFISDDIEKMYIENGIKIEDKMEEFDIPDEYEVENLKAQRFDDGILHLTFKKRETTKHGIA